MHRVEGIVSDVLAPRAVRCRVRRAGVVVELDPAAFDRLDPAKRQSLERAILSVLAAAGMSQPLSFALYRTGSAFLREPQ